MRLKRAGTGWRFFCPECDQFHVIDNRWKVMNELTESPTVVNSVKCGTCHLTITDGVIIYHNDSIPNKR